MESVNQANLTHGRGLGPASFWEDEGLANVETIAAKNWTRTKGYVPNERAYQGSATVSGAGFSPVRAKVRHLLFMILKNALYWGSCLLMASWIFLAARALLT